MTPYPTHDTDPLFKWDDGHPVSQRFGDVYFNRADGLKETEYVFLEGCNIQSLFAHIPRPVIAELGFGTGLNALATFESWIKRPKTTPQAGETCGAYLHYISVEGYPLTHAQLTAALAPWTDRLALIPDLIAAYPSPIPHDGFQRFWLPEHRICITLLIGQAIEMLSELVAHVDAWYLDGFAPAKNPEMWSQDLFQQIARLSKTASTPQDDTQHLGTRLATFTAAGAVRRGLADVGFTVEKRKGYGRKRHMTVAHFTDATQTQVLKETFLPPWMSFDGPGTPLPIIGGGIAGACVARAFLDRGITPTLHESAATLGAGASGNPAGLVKPKLDRAPNAGGLFQQRAFDYARRLYQRWSDIGHWTGTFEKDTSSKEQNKHQELLECAHIAADVATYHESFPLPIPTTSPSPAAGLFLNSAGFIIPQKAIAHLVDGAIIHLNSPQDQTEQCITCTGVKAWDFSPIDAVLQMTPRLGQVTTCKSQWVKDFSHPLCFGHYLLPLDAEHLLMGATFDPIEKHADLPAPTSGADRRNINATRTALDIAPEALNTDHITGHRTSIRATTPDRLPYVGPIPDADWTFSHYQTIHHGRYSAPLPPLNISHHRWGLIGLGSRGLTTAPLAAELLVSQILNDPWPIPLSEAKAVAPIRDVFRQLKSNK